ncbi:MAG: outer membrane lipoprotein-sorting protein [Acidobacteriota bacterium]|nr:outer membrane lipoprotein-sorting protein [Acidobacteriota bacterium]
MRMQPTWWRTSLAGLLLAFGAHSMQAQDLASVIRQMDASSKTFHSAEADFKWELYERVVRETTTQNGSIYFVKQGGSTQMGARILPPNAKFLEYKGGDFRMFDPVSDHLVELKAGDKQSQVEGFLALGFGASGSDLLKSWNVTLVGTETLNDGERPVATVKLDLVSKDPAVRNSFSHIILWVDPVRDISLRQKSITPSGDEKTASYTHIRMNKPVNTRPYEIKTDKNTTR